MLVRDAEQIGHARPGNARRALVVAGEALADGDVWERIFAQRPRTPVIEVLAPVLQSRAHFVTTDIDKEAEDARRRLDETFAGARRHGLDASGQVGDPIDPFAALVDQLSRYDVDEVIVATHGIRHPQAAPYDAINVAAAAHGQIPTALEEQLAQEGRLVVPVDGGLQRLMLVERRDGVGRQTLEGVRFVPLVGEG